ncbi:carbohydrate ABC transporter permease [Roseisalinus antarcticus]|uniref:carbohydrate ABC transporter permease n=1 Tax=Roseisalinus antarcticus TaxID=254357 RepID=UPI001F2972EB|nr:carbohydrate ABC transporter permease [Roseisalinus antarcticus]
MSLAVASVVFILPFLFIFINAAKTPAEASQPSCAMPNEWQLRQNLVDVVQVRDDALLLAYFNSIVITAGAMTLLVILAAMVGYVLQRRPTPFSKFVEFVALAGLMILPAVVPTIWVLQQVNLFKTIHGMILIQVAYGLSFRILLFRAFISLIPRDLDEAAIVDGATPVQAFFRVILPLLTPLSLTVIVVQSITIFNDCTHPLHYLPGPDNITVQLTLHTFQSQFTSQLNLLFMNILLITIPPLLVFVVFDRQIVAGMTSGAVKG